jgi:hypothetical protein
LAGAVNVDLPTVPAAAFVTFCVDNERAIDDAAPAEDINLDIICVRGHDMTGPNPRADRHVLSIL